MLCYLTQICNQSESVSTSLIASNIMSLPRGRQICGLILGMVIT